MKAAEPAALVKLQRLVRAVARSIQGIDRNPRRFPVNLRFVFEVDGEVHQCFSRDLSVRGVFLNTDHPVETGSELALTFQLPGGSREIHCAGIARHRRGDEHGYRRQGVGVEFTGLSSRDASRLERFLGEETGES